MGGSDATVEERDRVVLGRRRTLWLTGSGLSLIAVCYGMARFAYGLFVPDFRAEFALGAGTAGVIASGSYVSYCVAIIAATALTPRFGGRAVAVAAGVIATVGVVTVAVAPTAVVLAAGVLVAGSSTGVASPPLAHAVAHTVREQLRDRTQAVINAGTGVGVAVAGPIALLPHEQWRAAWVVFAIICALATLWAALAVPPGQTGRSVRPAAGRSRPTLAAGSGSLITAAALLGIASSAVWTFGRDVLVTSGGMSGSSSSVAWILLGTFGVLGAAAGDLGRRFGIGNSWTATVLVMGAATALLGVLPGNLGTALLAAAAFGASYIAASGFLLIWGTEIYPDAPATGVGLAFLVLALGQAAGAPLVGALSERGSPLVAFLAAAAVAVLGAVVRPRGHRTS